MIIVQGFRNSYELAKRLIATYTKLGKNTLIIRKDHANYS